MPVILFIRQSASKLSTNAVIKLYPAVRLRSVSKFVVH